MTGVQTCALPIYQTWNFPDASGTIALDTNIWSSLGNTGTVAGTNFLGTIDAVDFVAKTNNTERLRILSTGQIKLNSLTGTGTRMVVANASGQLGTQTITSPTLQTVTDAGNITTNDMSVITPFDTSSVNVENTTDSSKATLIQELNDGGRIELTTATGNTLVLKCNLLTAFRTIQFPDTNGTVALLSDINPGNTWNVVGNAGTTAGTNFIGTTDSIDFVTKTNNVERLRVLESGELIILDLAGSGTRMVVADSTGQLSTQAITSPTLQVVTSGTNKNLIDGINLQGTGAGDAQSGTNVNAFGVDAAKNNTGNFVNAIGYNAAKFNTSN